MEGDRILRTILNKAVCPSLAKDVENYLSPMETSLLKQQDATSAMKYHAFSLKLLRCCIQGFENSKSEVVHLLEICKVAVTCLGITCNYLTKVNNIESCQLERLIKLLYHFLAYLNKVEDFERFLWFAGKMMNFCKLQGKKNEVPDQELSKIYEKIFEMHWTLGGKMIKSKQHSEAFYMRVHGILFVLEMNKDLAKVNKYLENCILNFMQGNKDGNQMIDPATSLLMVEVIKCLYGCGLSPNSSESVQIKGLSTYAILLSYKLLLVHSDSKDCLQGLSQHVNSKANGAIKNLFIVLIEAYRTNFSLRACTNHKLKKELCKQANSVKQYLKGFETIHEELVKSKLLIANPKITLVYDLLKMLLSFKEVLCWDVLIELAKVATSLKKHIELLQMNICTEAQDDATNKISGEMKNVLGILLTQWYSFCCWCLQVFQLWLSKDGKSKPDAKCSCTTKSSHHRADLFEYCCNLTESASRTLQLMKDSEIEYRESEHKWVNVASYNFAIMAQKETSLKIAIKLLGISFENLKVFVQIANNGTDQSDSLARIQQVNLVTKNKLLVDILVKAGHADKALSQIAEFVRFLLDMDVLDIDSKTMKELIRDQVNLWINTKEKIKAGAKNGVRVSLLSKELEESPDLYLKLISEIEITEIKAKGNPSWSTDVKDLLSFIIERFEETDNVFVSWALLEYASLPADIISLSKRMKLCNEAIVLLEEETAKDDVTNCSQDLLAMAYFYLGSFQHKSIVVKSRSAKQENNDFELCEPDDSNGRPSKSEEPESIDFIASFNTSMDIWTLLIQAIFTDKNPSMVEETFSSLHKASNCLLYIGIVYCLNRQRLNAIHALHLTALLAELSAVQTNNTPDSVDTRLNASFEMSRLLAELFDFPSASNVLSKVTASTTKNSSCFVQRQIAEASLLIRAGEHHKAQSILENTLCDKMVLQKTPKSFLLKADALLVFALCQEYPGNTSDVQDHHPLVIAQEALKILRNLLALYLDTKDDSLLGREPSSSKHKNEKQELMSVTPWIVLDRLLDCLLYIAQRYKMQGCIPEARCHVKEGLMLCDEFSLQERKSEFLIEEAEAGIISDEADKTEKALKEVSQMLLDKTMDNSNKYEIPPFHRHALGCTCEFCADVFLPTVCLNCLILRRKLRHIKTGNVDCQAKRVSIEVVLKSAMEKAKSSVKDLRAVLTLGMSKKKKKVTFENQDVKDNDLNMKELLKDSSVFDLDAVEITKLIYSAENIELICLDCKDAVRSAEDEMLEKLDMALREMRSSKYWTLICRNFRGFVVMILQHKADLLLKTERGMNAIDSLWNVSSDKVWMDASKQDCKVDGSCESERTETDGEADCHKPKRSQKKSTRGRKAKGTKKTAKSSCQNEEHGELHNGRSCVSMNDEIQRKDEMIKKLNEICAEALSFLVSDLDCMLIKKFYQILSLVSGYRDFHQTVYLEQLAFSRSLHQQLLVRTLKNMRKKTKEKPTTEKPAATNDDQLEMASSILQNTSDVFAFKNHQILNQQLADNLPKDWRICSLRLSNIGKRCLIITRMQAGKEPLLLRIPIIDQEDDELEDSAVGGLVRDLASAFVTDPLEELEEILEQSLRSLETEDVKSWWNNRKKLDARLKRTLAKIENTWLGHWKGVLLGTHLEINEEAKVDLITEEICKKIKEDCCVDLRRSIVKILLDSYPSLDRMQVNKAFQTLLGAHFTESVLEVFIEKAEEFGVGRPKSESLCTPVKGRKSRKAPATCEEAKQVKRGPVILILDEELQRIPWESMPVLRNQIVSRMPSLVLTKLGLLTSKELVQNGVDVTNTFYILNPRNDLQNTQKTFEKWFQREQGWSGISGRAPSEVEYKSALEDHDLFIYCGHGNGREFLRGDDIQRITCRAVTLLMGCSSGKLQVKGRLDARGMALNYLMAGCPAIVANLWDVTDKDIDRFLTKLLREWMEQRGNILNYVATARDECFLPYLIGASPVVYGLPLICQFN